MGFQCIMLRIGQNLNCQVVSLEKSVLSLGSVCITEVELT